MKKFKAFQLKTAASALALTALFGAGVDSFAKVRGGIGTGGGSEIAFDFVHAAERGMERASRTNGLQQLPFQKMKDKLEDTDIFVTDKELYTGEGLFRQEVPVINDIKSGSITINGPKWDAITSRPKKESLALHEILSLLEIEGSGNYKHSQKYYLSEIESLNVVFSESVKPQVLNKVENPELIMVIYADFESPFMGMYSESILAAIKKYGKRMRFIVRNYPIWIHDSADLMARIGICAHEQGLFTEAFEHMMKVNTYFTHEFNIPREKARNSVQNIAQLNQEELDKCLNAPRTQMRLDLDAQQAAEHYLMGAPDAFIHGRNGSVRISGARYTQDLLIEIEKAFKLYSKF